MNRKCSRRQSVIGCRTIQARSRKQRDRLIRPRIHDRSLIVRHGHRDCAGRGGVACSIPSDGRERVRAIRGRGRVPGYRIGSSRILGSQVGAVEFELNTDDTDVVGSRAGINPGVVLG